MLSKGVSSMSFANSKCLRPSSKFRQSKVSLSLIYKGEKWIIKNLNPAEPREISKISLYFDTVFLVAIFSFLTHLVHGCQTNLPGIPLLYVILSLH
jgi:hypothetical protein